MKTQSAKAKGKLLENWVADQIRAKGIDPRAYREFSSGAGNREKADIYTSMQILGRQAMIECKNQRNVCLDKWWKQVEKITGDGEPILVYKFHFEPLEATKVSIYLDTLLDLINENKQLKEKLCNQK